MVDVVKRDGEVSLRYMKSFEHDQIVYERGVEQGRQAEIKNTERERQRADIAQSKVEILEEEVKRLRALTADKQ